MSKNLFEDSDDNVNDDGFRIKTNEEYAKTYNTLKKKELLQKVKGFDASESDSDDSSSEEDEILDPTFDKEFLKTLASLKSKDPSIYDKNTKFFKSVESDDDSAEEGVDCKTNKEKKSKPVTLKDYERKIILENEGKFESDTDDENQDFQRVHSPTLAEEESRLKAELKKLVNQEDDSSNEAFGGIFKKREKTKAEKDKEEEDYLKWLAGKGESIKEDVKEALKPLKNYWSNDKLPSNEKFLRDYVLNKGYTEASNYNEIPTYEEIVGDKAPLSEDELELEKQAEFEVKYNFRYEEPDEEFIKRYPRTIETSVRLTDEKRKKKRQEIKQRKLQEKQQKLKELELVKEMKRKEIQEKIEKLKMVTGNDELGFKDDDLENDFDPEAHDRRMQELFNDDFYQIDEGEEKPECPSDIEELKVEDWDNYDPQQNIDSNDYNDELHCEDEDFNMDCDYDPTKAKEELQKELIENTKKRRAGRKGRRDRFMEIIKAEKPVFQPEDEKTYGEYIDEYYKIDCEDIIGDTPCRFKYVETTPNDFGLTIEEILLAKNKELNQWASLKKAIQIRPEYVERKDQRIYKLKSRNDELKRKIFKSLYGEGSDDENEQSEEGPLKEENIATKPETVNTNSELVPKSKNAKKRRKRKVQNVQVGSKTTDEDFNKNGQAIEAKTKETAQTFETEADVCNIKRKKIKNDYQSQSQIEKKTTTDADKQIYPTNKSSQNKNEPPNDSKPVTKYNPFAESPSIESIGMLPALRKNLSKRKKCNDKSNVKFKSKFQNKKTFKGKFKSKEDSKNISDERLKAYGINPKKFHKKQKYGNVK